MVGFLIFLVIWLHFGLVGFALKNFCYKSAFEFEGSLPESVIWGLLVLSLIFGPITFAYAVREKLFNPDYEDLCWGFNFHVKYPR